MDDSQFSEYLLSRAYLWKSLMDNREKLGQIAEKGIMTKEEERLARIACALVVSDIFFEEQSLKFVKNNICLN